MVKGKIRERITFRELRRQDFACGQKKKKSKREISVAPKLVCEKWAQGKAAGSGGGGGGGGGPLGAQLKLQLRIHLNLACGSVGPEKTLTCTNVAQAKYWKRKKLRRFVQTTENKSNKVQTQMRLS